MYAIVVPPCPNASDCRDVWGKECARTIAYIHGVPKCPEHRVPEFKLFPFFKMFEFEFQKFQVLKFDFFRSKTELDFFENKFENIAT